MWAFTIASICYLAVFIWLLHCLIFKINIHKGWNLVLCFVGMVSHALCLYPNIVTEHGLDFNLVNVSSLISFFLILFFSMFCLYRKIITLGILAAPVALIGITVGYFGNTTIEPLQPQNTGLTVHIVLSIAAYSMLLMSAVQAIILRLQIKELKHSINQKSRIWSASLPCLQTMEALLFDMLIIGFGLLTMSLLLGFMYIDNYLTQEIAPKTIICVMSWLVFLYLIFAHWRYGWRGKRASTFTLYGFALLALGFVGSKVFFEIIV